MRLLRVTREVARAKSGATDVADNIRCYTSQSQDKGKEEMEW